MKRGWNWAPPTLSGFHAGGADIDQLALEDLNRLLDEGIVEEILTVQLQGRHLDRFDVGCLG